MQLDERVELERSNAKRNKHKRGPEAKPEPEKLHGKALTSDQYTSKAKQKLHELVASTPAPVSLGLPASVTNDLWQMDDAASKTVEQAQLLDTVLHENEALCLNTQKQFDALRRCIERESREQNDFYVGYRVEPLPEIRGLPGLESELAPMLSALPQLERDLFDDLNRW